MFLLSAVLGTFARTLTFSGTASRTEYWVYQLGVVVPILVLQPFAARFENQIYRGLFSSIVPVLLVLPNMSLTVRRLHDTDRTGWWLLVSIIPFAGSLILLYFCVLPSRSKTADWPGRSAHRFGQFAVCALGLLILLRLVWAPYWIPSGKMKPNLLIGDFLYVNTWARDPIYGEVAVFRHPVNGQDFIKRVVGLPGDSVQMRSGVLHINGSPAPQVPDGAFVETFERQGPIGTTPVCVEGQLRFGDECTKVKFVETLPNGNQHAVLDARQSRVDNTGVFRVPEGMFFFMGDNRDNSTDSRVPQPHGVGLVPFENIIGRANRVMFSSAGKSLFFVWTWRSDRFFKRIN